MIYFFLIQNLQGVTRLSKWYSKLEDPAEIRRLEGEVHRLTAYRADEMTNAMPFTVGKHTGKLLYRRYAALVFALGVDVGDNELQLLESLHLFVEMLDEYFKNVCELDIVFNFHKVLAIVDEFYLAGELQETNKQTILERIRDNEKLD